MNQKEAINTEKPQSSASPVERLVIFEESIKTLREMLAVQCADGNWNYDPYMHGMANGMIFALSLFDNKRPEYIEAPDVWLCDIPDACEPITVCSGI
jgi:hypothetical protein